MPPHSHLLLLLLGYLFCHVTALTESNLSCYQCTRYTNEECGKEDLLPCPASKDRCVTHISKDARNGFVMKRECGLGPCGFEDAMMNRGLGLEGCDRSKDEYFCVFCCPTSGCNKDTSSAIYPSALLVLAATVLLGELQHFITHVN
ncbi:uncharacterized protein [Anabrus simplex]|uniref:uncharacterized protein n=1 Tax=Anabrus simplex TaxID=316456 RepID=UPI0034DD1FA2